MVCPVEKGSLAPECESRMTCGLQNSSQLQAAWADAQLPESGRVESCFALLSG